MIPDTRQETRREVREARLLELAKSNPTLRRALSERFQRGNHVVASSVRVATPPKAQAIAITAADAVLPGAPDLETFWNMLQNGETGIATIPPDRGGDGKIRAGLLEHYPELSPEAMGVTPKEAAGMDPHQKALLALAHRSLGSPEQSAIRGTRTGVFVAFYNQEFAACQTTTPDAFTSTNLGQFMAANRLSYHYDLSGPSEIVNVACSSFHLALHRAVQSLRAGECSRALVAGVSLLLSPERMRVLGEGGMLAADGVVRPFDRDASGQVMGEGVGLLVLKPLETAEADGETVLGVIRGSAVNHQGNRSGTPMMPDAQAQAGVIKAALHDAGLDHEAPDYLEAHGSGSGGDIVEWQAVADAFEERSRPLAIGSVKANVGFLEAAGGVSQVMKLILMMGHGNWVPTPGHTALPEALEGLNDRLFVPSERCLWTTTNEHGPFCAGLHAYGLGGVNVHLVLEGRSRMPVFPKADSAGWSSPVIFQPSKESTGMGGAHIHASDWRLADHMVNGRALLPAAVQLTELWEAAEASSGIQMSLAGNVFWLKPFWAHDGGCRMETSIEALAEGHAGKLREANEEEPNLLAHFESGHGSIPKLPEAAFQFESDAVERFSGEALYAAFADSGIQLGTTFQSLNTVVRGGHWLRAELRLKPMELSEETNGAPSNWVRLFDGVLQAAGLLLGDGAIVRLPYCAERVIRLGKYGSSEATVLARRSARGSASRADAWLLSEGKPMAFIEALGLGDLPAASEKLDTIEELVAAVTRGELNPLEASRRFEARKTETSRERVDLLEHLQGIVGDLPIGVIVSAPKNAGTSSGSAVAVASETVWNDLLAGVEDPTVAQSRGALLIDGGSDPDLARRFGARLFCHFNKSNCERYRLPDPLPEIYAEGVVQLSGGTTRHIYPWTIPARVAGKLLELASNLKGDTVEVGMAFGLASVVLCEARRRAGGGRHFAIDPCQGSDFENAGLEVLARAGLDTYLEFHEAEDAQVLPYLLADGRRCELAFIDGLHLFDYTLLDFFYCDRLLVEEGILVFDDAQLPAVERVIAFVEANRNYQRLPISDDRLAVYRKLADDERSLLNPNHFEVF